MLEPVTPSEGLGVVHIFCRRTPLTYDEAVLAAVKHADMWLLRDLQTGLTGAGLEVVDSFVSITELSEYAQGLPEEMAGMRSTRTSLPRESRPGASTR